MSQTAGFATGSWIVRQSPSITQARNGPQPDLCFETRTKKGKQFSNRAEAVILCSAACRTIWAEAKFWSFEVRF